MSQSGLRRTVMFITHLIISSGHRFEICFNSQTTSHSSSTESPIRILPSNVLCAGLAEVEGPSVSSADATLSSHGSLCHIQVVWPGLSPRARSRCTSSLIRIVHASAERPASDVDVGRA